METETYDYYGVIFDLDGTLIDSMRGFYSLVVEGLNRRGIKTTKETLRKVGSELIKDYQTTPSGQGIRLVFNLFWKIGRKSGLSRFRTISFTYECVTKARKVYHSASLFPDVKSTLTLLHDARFQLGVYTMASRKQMTESLIKHEILNFFNPKGLISRDDVKRAKPDPEGILLALKKCSIHPSKAVFIGDMPVDVIAGNKAAVKTIGITTGLIERHVFQHYCSPTAIFDSLEQATTWILRTKSTDTPNP